MDPLVGLPAAHGHRCVPAVEIYTPNAQLCFGCEKFQYDNGCAGCGELLVPGTWRVRRGCRGARVYHVGCIHGLVHTVDSIQGIEAMTPGERREVEDTVGPADSQMAPHMQGPAIDDELAQAAARKAPPLQMGLRTKHSAHHCSTFSRLE